MPIAMNPVHTAATAPNAAPRPDAARDDASSADPFLGLLIAAGAALDAAKPVGLAKPGADAKPDDGKPDAADPAAPALPVDAATAPATDPALLAMTMAIPLDMPTDGPVENAARVATAANGAADAVQAAGRGVRAVVDASATALPVVPATASARAAVVPDAKADGTREASNGAFATPPRNGVAVPGDEAPRAAPPSRGNEPPVTPPPAVTLPPAAALPTPKREGTTRDGDAIGAVAPRSAAPLANDTGSLAGRIEAPAFSPAWQTETASKLAQVVVVGTDRAEFQLHPKDLGPIAVRVDVDNNQATVTLVAAHADTRAALEQTLPQLRDLLAAQGITLGQATVQDGRPQADAGGGQRDTPPPPRDDAAGEPGATASRRLLPPISRGLVDTFA